MIVAVDGENPSAFEATTPTTVDFTGAGMLTVQLVSAIPPVHEHAVGGLPLLQLAANVTVAPGWTGMGACETLQNSG